MADFDMLEEVNSKFTGTVVMYDKKAATVKTVDKTNDGFILVLGLQSSRAYKSVSLNDPALDYKNYKIGYVNGGNYAGWWYRKPQKQWQQGLKSSQLGYVFSTPGAGPHDNFGFSGPFIKMLENIYPSVEEVKKVLMDGEYSSRAWHRDFALSYDQIHEDCILEYHGRKIGMSISPDLAKFKILSEARHLQEALEEARYNVHP